MAFWKRRLDSRDLNDTLRDTSLTVPQKLARLREQRTAIEQQLNHRHAFHLAFLGRWRDRRGIRANNKRLAKEAAVTAQERVEEMARRAEEREHAVLRANERARNWAPVTGRPSYLPGSALAILQSRGEKLYGY